MPYTLGEAAKATGKSKPTIQEAIKKGRISAVKDDFGRYQIDPAELHRVYPPMHKEEPQTEQSLTAALIEKEAKIRELQARLEALSELKAHIEREREGLREDKANLRRDVEQWQGVAFDFQQRLTALEAPRPEPSGGETIIQAAAPSARTAPEPEALSLKGFFRRIFG